MHVVGVFARDVNTHLFVDALALGIELRAHRRRGLDVGDLRMSCHVMPCHAMPMDSRRRVECYKVVVAGTVETKTVRVRIGSHRSSQRLTTDLRAKRAGAGLHAVAPTAKASARVILNIVNSSRNP